MKLRPRALSHTISHAIARMWDAPSFVIQGRRTYRIIAGLVCTIGLILSFGGSFLSTVGYKATVKYEKPGGKFIRAFSKEDRHDFILVKRLARVGRIVQGSGIAVILVGTVLLFFPNLLYRWMRDIGIESRDGG